MFWSRSLITLQRTLWSWGVLAVLRNFNSCYFLQWARDDNLLHLCSDKVALHVVPEAGYAKRIGEDAGPVRGIGQLSAAGGKPGADLSEQCLGWSSHGDVPGFYLVRGIYLFFSRRDPAGMQSGWSQQGSAEMKQRVIWIGSGNSTDVCTRCDPGGFIRDMKMVQMQWE